jgi:8-hydroxy-5-deazaflavin:NADPH oxidoreductase
MRVAVVGGTGKFGKALAIRLKQAGYDVVVGSRGAERAAAVAAELGVEGLTNEEAARSAELVVLATNADATLATAEQLREAIGDTPVLCVASELLFRQRGVYPCTDEQSLAERVQNAVRAPVAAGLHSLAARSLGGEEAPEEDALVCGDDEVAKELALQLAGRITRGRAVDAGPLASAPALEGLTAVIVNVNKRYKTHAGITLTGLP